MTFPKKKGERTPGRKEKRVQWFFPYKKEGGEKLRERVSSSDKSKNKRRGEIHKLFSSPEEKGRKKRTAL